LVNRLIEVPTARLALFVGTRLGSGLFPLMPATAGSLLALAIYWWTPLNSDSPGISLLISVGFLVGIWATESMSTPARPNLQRAFWDEFVGI